MPSSPEKPRRRRAVRKDGSTTSVSPTTAQDAAAAQAERDLAAVLAHVLGDEQPASTRLDPPSEVESDDAGVPGSASERYSRNLEALLAEKAANGTADDTDRQRLRDLRQRLAADPDGAPDMRLAERPELANRPHNRVPGGQDVADMLRRNNVMTLWTRSYSVGEIAETLHIGREQVRADVEYLQLELQRDILPEMHNRLNRSAATRLAVQQEAWGLYSRLGDQQHNKVGALQIILAAQDALDRLTGVGAPEEINAAALAEMQSAVMQTLYDLGGVEAQQAFIQRLRASTALARDVFPPSVPSAPSSDPPNPLLVDSEM